MTDETAPPVVVPYSRFVEFQHRRDKPVEPVTPDQPPTTGADVPPVPSHNVWRHS
jgi:hypothetical protein